MPSTVGGFCTAYTLVTFAGLSFYVHITKKDFSFLRGFLVAAFWIMVLSAVIMMFFPSMRAMMPYSAFGTLVFACWILYDTSNVVHHVHCMETAAIAGFELLLDLVGLFRHLLNLLWSLAED